MSFLLSISCEKRWIAAYAGLVFLSIFLRFYQIDNRPMHTDEAVHAVKFGKLLEDGIYKYDPLEYHGPSLYYLTLIPAFISGEKKFSELQETTLRSVPAIASIVMFLLLPLFFGGKDKKLMLSVLLLWTLSPALLFYSRYYIQETLLVSFFYAALFAARKYHATFNPAYIILSGLLLGPAIASKETVVIGFGAAVFAYLIIMLLERKKFFTVKIAHWFGFFTVVILVAALFYSSFGKNPGGITDFFHSFSHYLRKAGNNESHIQPWYYYLKLLLMSSGKFYGEIPVFLLFLFGSVFILRKPGVNALKFILLFSLILFFIYSAIPYKTPWLIINFLTGFLMIAGFGFYQLWKISGEMAGKALVAFLMLLVLAESYQLYLVNFRYPWRPENPYTYSQPSPSIVSVSRKMLNIAENKMIKSAVIVKNHEYWPLPWYLRRLKYIGWYDAVPDSVYNFSLIAISPELEEILNEKLYSLPPPGKRYLYVPLFLAPLELRPGRAIQVYARLNILNGETDAR